MTHAAYTGSSTMTFPDYTDLGTGKTLRAQPGRSYDIAPASGRMVADLPAGWFTPLGGEPPQQVPAESAPAESAEPEPEAERPEQPAEPRPEDDAQPQEPQDPQPEDVPQQ